MYTQRTRYSGTYDDDVLGGSKRPADGKGSRARGFSINSLEDTDTGFGMFGQVDLAADQIECLERMGEWNVTASYQPVKLMTVCALLAIPILMLAMYLGCQFFKAIVCHHPIAINIPLLPSLDKFLMSPAVVGIHSGGAYTCTIETMKSLLERPG